MISAVGIIAASALVAACGGDDDDSSSSNNSSAGPDVAPTRAAAAPTVAASAPSSAPALQTVTLKTGERGQEYFFDQKEVKLKPGQVKVTITNDGPDRPHDFVVANLNGQGNLAQSTRLNPGQTGEVTFAVAVGTYNFICSLPGHADRGAKGTIVVAN